MFRGRASQQKRSREHQSYMISGLQRGFGQSYLMSSGLQREFGEVGGLADSLQTMRLSMRQFIRRVLLFIQQRKQPSDDAMQADPLAQFPARIRDIVCGKVDSYGSQRGPHFGAIVASCVMLSFFSFITCMCCQHSDARRTQRT